MEKIDEILENMEFLDNWEDKYKYIIELGQGLDILPDDLIDETLINEPIEELFAKVDEIEGSIDVSDTKNEIFQPEPKYPIFLQQKNISGSVKVEFIINKEGRTGKIRIIETSHPGFNRPVVEAIKKWKYGPQKEELKDIKLFTFKLS